MQTTNHRLPRNNEHRVTDLNDPLSCLRYVLKVSVFWTITNQYWQKQARPVDWTGITLNYLILEKNKDHRLTEVK